MIYFSVSTCAMLAIDDERESLLLIFSQLRWICKIDESAQLMLMLHTYA